MDRREGSAPFTGSSRQTPNPLHQRHDAHLDQALPAKNAARAKLARTKRAATILLAVVFVTALIARAVQHLHPALGFLAAFAEAATVGGLADWFAVVALFRRPLGLPIPHTAIISNNRHRIATSLGEFVQVHFLGSEIVSAKLRSIDFVYVVRRWLEVPRNSAGLAQAILRLLPQFTHAFEHSGAGSLRSPSCEGRRAGSISRRLPAISSIS